MFDNHSKTTTIAGTLPTGETVTARTRKGHKWIVVVQQDEATPIRTWGARSQAVAQEQADFHCQRHGFAVGMVCQAV